MSGEDELVTIPANTLIHIEGIPFRMWGPTLVRGTEQNRDLALSLIKPNPNETGSGDK